MKDFCSLVRPFAMLCILLMSFLLLSCASKQETEYTQTTQAKGYFQISKSEVRGLVNRLYTQSGDNFSWLNFKSGVEKNIKYLSCKPQQSVAGKYGKLEITWEMLRRTNEACLKIIPQLDTDPDLLSENFVWYSMSPRTLLTGYYEPYLEASLTPDPEYPYPLYSVPADLKQINLGDFHNRWKGQKLLYRLDGDKIVPYFDRKAIDFDEALRNRGLEIAWVKDLVDVFILQIQGSGRLVLRDGKVKHVLYAGKNGLEYVSLGRILIERGLLAKEGMSMQKIRSFLKQNPDLVEELLTTNPSYVFFRLDDEGPFGSMGAALTPMVSVASDTEVFPNGALGLLTTRLPVQGENKKRAFTQIIMSQDRGGAIKGTRVDLFCGSGPEAEFLAGHLTSWSHIYIPISRKVFNEMQEQSQD